MKMSFRRVAYETSQYTVLEIQFRSVNYTFVAKICKTFRAKQALLVVLFKAKVVYNSWF